MAGAFGLWVLAEAFHDQGGSVNFSNPREGMASPLAKRLFAIDGVTSVFFGSDFVTVSKGEDAHWNLLKPEVFASIMEHFSSGAFRLPRSSVAGTSFGDSG